MTDTLLAGNRAATLWLMQPAYESRGLQSWQTVTMVGTCSTTPSGTTRLQSYWPTGTTALTASTFLGVDATTGLGYFSFTFTTHMSDYSWQVNGTSAPVCTQGGTVTGGKVWPSILGTTGIVITVSGNSQCTPLAPIDNHKAFPYIGWPVVACVLVSDDGAGNRTWYPINAASASANTLAAAITAASVTLAPSACDTAVTILGFA